MGAGAPPRGLLSDFPTTETHQPFKNLNLRACALSHSVRPDSLRPRGLLCPWDSPGKNTGVGCHFLLQGIFPTQGWNPGLLHWQVDSLPLHHLGKHPQNSVEK